MRVKDSVKFAVVLLVFFCNASLFAGLVQPYVAGTSSAALITEGDYAGWYLYKIDIDWDLGQPGEGAGLSHWDIILKQNCVLPDHLIEFDTPAGFSTSEDFPYDVTALGWTGYFERNGDPSLSSEEKPVVKYDSPHYPEGGEPGPAGSGTFFFYSNIIPENGIHPDALVGKAGNIPDTYGELTGAYPSCTIVPEPATIIMLGLGSGFLLMRKY